MKKTINIIDPTSTEFNRGSFCYAPYLAFNGLSENPEYEVSVMEGFTAEEMDTIPQADVHIVCLWSYPQIEICVMLAQLLPTETGKDNVYFVGYNGLISHLGLRHSKEYLGFDLMQEPEFLRTAMKTYPKNYKNFKNLLLSDCDMHLKALDHNETVYPLFTSYGCPNGCSFCPSTFNCALSRYSLSIEEVDQIFTELSELGIYNIHFTDEDFFYDIHRAYKILKSIEDEGFHLIALGSADAVLSFIETYGTNVIERAGLEVIEIGFESASEDMSLKMGKGKSLTSCETIAKKQKEYPFHIFWLVQTFFSGETIQSLNETGRFMKEYGMSIDAVLGRLRTNGTEGGLGQFFQPYHGTAIYKAAARKGTFLTSRAVRLMPSYIPDTFLESIITEINTHLIQEALPWLTLYGIEDDLAVGLLDMLRVGVPVSAYIPGKLGVIPTTKLFLCFAILARMEVIK